MEFPPPPPPPPRPERSKRLHNFTLPYLRWGQQRFLRCVKLPHPNNRSSLPSSSSSPSPDRRSPAIAVDFDLSKPKVGEEEAKIAARPWNLRTRRAACNEPGDESTKIVEPSSSSVRRNEIGNKRGHHQEGDGDLMNNHNKNEKVKFSVSLLREEIEEDFTALIGKKPPRRPKKRPRLVQKQMNTLFPGLWLAEEVTEGSYDVPESAET